MVFFMRMGFFMRYSEKLQFFLVYLSFSQNTIQQKWKHMQGKSLFSDIGNRMFEHDLQTLDLKYGIEYRNFPGILFVPYITTICIQQYVSELPIWHLNWSRVFWYVEAKVLKIINFRSFSRRKIMVSQIHYTPHLKNL